MSTVSSWQPGKDSNRDTRNDLLQAAFELFAQMGFGRVHLSAIADRAGVSIGLIRHYFDSKDGLVEECTQAVIDRLRAIFRHILDGSGPKEGSAFVGYLQDRTSKAFSGDLDLLRYLRHLTIENPPVANEVFREYFMLLQQELIRVEAAGYLREDANRVWLTFHLMYMQMGPIFLSEQIEAITGAPSHSPDSIRERLREHQQILKRGILSQRETPKQ